MQIETASTRGTTMPCIPRSTGSAIVVRAFALCIQLIAVSAYAQDVRICGPEPTDMAIAYGDVVSCVLDVPGDSDTFRFAASAGESIVLKGTRGARGSVRPCLELFAPDNTRTMACANDATNRIDATFSQSGVYTLLLRDLFTGPGDYTVALIWLSLVK